MHKPIVITSESISDISAESDYIVTLIEEFGCRVHLRKKNSTKEEMDILCTTLIDKGVDREYITLHSHLTLVQRYGFGGYHAKFSELDNIKSLLSDNVLISMSCHTTNEADSVTSVDYLFLSPIFNSISKVGYTSNFNIEELSGWLNTRRANSKVVALGGIDATNIDIAYNMGFSEVAVLGAIWQGGNPILNYKKLLKR